MSKDKPKPISLSELEARLAALLTKVAADAAFDAPEMHNFSCWDAKLKRALMGLLLELAPPSGG